MLSLNIKIFFYLSLFLHHVVCQLEEDVSTRILTLGDQVVVGSVPGGFRQTMYYTLNDDGYNVDMIGTQTSNPFSNEMDPDHEGYSDKPILFFDDLEYFRNLRDSIEVPDVIIVYVGTTDFEEEFEIPMAVYRYANLLENLATIFPSANIIASTLLGGYENPFINTLFNDNLNDRLYELTLKKLKVSLADVASAVGRDQMDDEVFPSQGGYDAMAGVYVKAIKSVISPKGDHDPPVITNALNPTTRRIRLNFSKPLSDGSNLNSSNFELDYDIQVNSVVLLSSKRAIILKTSDFSNYNSQEVPLKVTVKSGIKDLVGMNLAPNSSITFLLGRSTGGFPSTSGTSYPTLPPAPLGIQTLSPAISSTLPQSTTRILSMGDMLTVGGGYPGGYRDHLFDLLTAVKYNVDMVGTRTSNPGRMPLDHEGWALKSIDWFVNMVPDLLESIPDPDVILLHLGMVDIVADESLNEDAVKAVHRYQELLRTISLVRPHVNIIATNLIQHEFWQFDNKVQSTFNDEVKDAVEAIASRGAKVTYLDMRSAVSPYMVKSDNDELDLNDYRGYVRMAQAWFSAVLDVIGPNGDSSTPEITRVKASRSYNQIDIDFSKPISDDSTNKRNFILEYNIMVENVRLDSEKRTLTLLTTDFSFMEGAPLELTIRNGGVFDRTPERRMVRAGTTFTFQVPSSSTPTMSPANTPAPSPSAFSEDDNCGSGKGKKKKKGKGKKKKKCKGKKGKGKGGKGRKRSQNIVSISTPSPSPKPVSTIRYGANNYNNVNQAIPSPTVPYAKGKKGKKKGKQLR